MTETGGQGTDWALSLSSEQAADFLRRLATDDDFRSQLERSPQEAFAASGIPAPADALTGDVRVPPKAALLAIFGPALPTAERPSFVGRFVHRLRAAHNAPPFAGFCKCWALAYLAGSRVQK